VRLNISQTKVSDQHYGNNSAMRMAVDLPFTIFRFSFVILGNSGHEK
jgi:hypothetical protein